MKIAYRFFLAFLLIFPTTFLTAQDTVRTWTGAQNNDFRNTQNWTPAGPPENTHVIIPQDSVYPVLSSRLFAPVRSVNILIGGRLDVTGPLGRLDATDSLRIDSTAILVVNSTDTVALNIGGKSNIAGALTTSPVSTGRLDFHSVNVVSGGSLLVGGASQVNIATGDSVVINAGGFAGVVSTHVNPVNVGGNVVIGGTLDIAQIVGGVMNFGGKLIVPSKGSFHIAGPVQISNIQDDLILNGSLSIDPTVAAEVGCRGNWIRGAGSTFGAGASTFYFENPSRQLNVDRGTFHTLVLGPALNNLRIFGNVNVASTLVLRDTVVILPGDTLTISERSIVAIIDSFGGRIARGAVRRAIDTTITGRFRFHDSNIAVEFLNTTGIPGFITIAAEPDSDLLISPFRFVRRFYDIGSQGGGSFRARLFVRYDSSEVAPGTDEDSLRLWRTTDNGQTWNYVPSSVDTASNVVTTDTISEFSKWGFGHPNSPPTRVRDLKSPLPTQIDLFQNYPNPFNPVTRIWYSIHKSNFVTIKVFNLLGHEVATLVQGEQSPGNYEIEWAPMNQPSGVYFLRMQAGDFVQTRKMIFLR